MEARDVIRFSNGALSPRFVIESDNVPAGHHVVAENEPRVLTFKTERKLGSPNFLFLDPHAAVIEDRRFVSAKRGSKTNVTISDIPWENVFQPHAGDDYAFALEIPENLSPRKLSPDLQGECRKAIRDLLSVAGKRNWDGEDADPVTEYTVEAALKIVAQFPGETGLPEVSADAEGNIEFDWHLENGSMFTISIRRTGDVAISGLCPGSSKLTAMVKDRDGKDFSLLQCGLKWLYEMRERRQI